MRYIQPQITGTFDAVKTIKGMKQTPHVEAVTQIQSNGAAYPADE